MVALIALFVANVMQSKEINFTSILTLLIGLPVIFTYLAYYQRYKRGLDAMENLELYYIGQTYYLLYYDFGLGMAREIPFYPDQAAVFEIREIQRSGDDILVLYYEYDQLKGNLIAFKPAYMDELEKIYELSRA